MPMIVNFGAGDERNSAILAKTVLGASLAASSIPVAIFAGLGLWWGEHPLGSTALAFALVLPGLLLQQCCISLLYARQRQLLAVATNSLWLVTGLSGLLALPRIASSDGAWVYVLAYGGAAYVSAGAAMVMLAAWPALGSVHAWYKEQRSSIVDLTVSDLLSRATGQSTVWILGLVGGLSITAGLRAASIPLGVPRILLSGLAPAMLAEGTRIYARRPEQLGWLIRGWAGIALALVACVGLAFAAGSDTLGPAVGGDSWALAAPILGWAVAIAAANTVIVPAQVGMNSLGSTRLAALTRAWTAPVPPLGTLVGGILMGGHGAVAGTAVGMLLTAVVQITAFERTFRRLQNYGG
ncbi:MAG: hypothetical protein WBG57_04220 [Ornithinimicrobium sp.]